MENASSDFGFNASSHQDIEPPTHLLTDFVEIGYILIVLVFGVPLNLFVCVQQLREYKSLIRAGKYDLNTAFLLQKIHLNGANLMILLFHCPTQMGWLITYKWEAGDFMCKFVHFIWLISFILSSNIVVVIGLDRYRNVCRMEAMWSSGRSNRHIKVPSGGSAAMRPVYVLLTVAWVEAFIGSMAQWWAWNIISLDDTWAQCTTIWEKWEYEEYLRTAGNLTVVREHPQIS